MAVSLQQRLSNYIIALEAIIASGDPQANGKVALTCIVVSFNFLVTTISCEPFVIITQQRECTMLVMIVLASDPKTQVPVILLSAAMELDRAMQNGCGMDVSAISEHDMRVVEHPWYSFTSQARVGSRRRARDVSCIFNESDVDQNNLRAVPPRMRLALPIKEDVHRGNAISLSDR